MEAIYRSALEPKQFNYIVLLSTSMLFGMFLVQLYSCTYNEYVVWNVPSSTIF